jgi:hypothetical protein
MIKLFVLAVAVGCATAPKPLPTCEKFVAPLMPTNPAEAFPLSGECSGGVAWVSQYAPTKKIKYVVGTICEPEIKEISTIGPNYERVGECQTVVDGEAKRIVIYRGEVTLPAKRALRK